jgi:DNA-directed RNA polymerase subunit alpha
MRAYNSLKRNNITKIGQLLALGDDELLRMRNFGQKSLDEMKERLALRGFIAPDGVEGSSDEADLPGSAELDEAAAAQLDREE